MADFEEKLQSILNNQEAMGQIMSLARSLSGESNAPKESGEERDDGNRVEQEKPSAPYSQSPDLSELLGELDPRMIQVGMEVVRQMRSTEDRNVALLNALRPFLREERRGRLDRALQIARMTRLIRVAIGALGGKEEEEGV